MHSDELGFLSGEQCEFWGHRSSRTVERLERTESAASS